MIFSTLSRAAEINRVWLDCAALAADSQQVVAMRLMGMGGAWSVPRGEGGEMLREKLPAFTEAYVSGVLSVLAGRDPDRVLRAMLEPLSDLAALNRDRLSALGPAIPGMYRRDTDETDRRD